MPAIAGFVEGHNYVVADAECNLLQAARAQVFLARLKRVNEGDLEVVLVVAV